jgi:hypothetical protein
MRGRWCLLAVVVLDLGGACAEDPTAAEAWCEGVCSAVRRCGYDAPSCKTNCVQQRPGLAKQSVAGALAQKPCLERLSCAAIGGDDAAWTTEVDACWTEAALSVAVTDRARRFCPEYSLAWFECGYTLPVSECDHGFSMWSDPVIDRLAACEANLDCNGFQTCVSNAFSSL